MLKRALAALLFVAPLPRRTRADPDLIVTNARIYTVDATRPIVDAMAVRGGKVVATGPRRLIEAMRGPQTRTLDASGRTIIPGMVDAHAHLAGLGQALTIVDLVGTTSYQQIIDKVAARAKEVPAGTWVLGRGWDQNDWADTRFPTHDA
ncbi:MAG: amidohydrolase family protein [Gemmatimonadaceae bacterium]